MRRLMADPDVDVVVVGGSIAGCAAAIRFSQLGHRVAILDKKVLDDTHYKRLCTHFVQPHAVPLLAGLGLADLYGPDSSVTTKAVFVTPGGLVEGPGGYDPDRPGSYALNLERRVLDPAIRASARRHGVRFLDDTTVEGIDEDGDGWVLRTGSDPVRARLVIAADGRRSTLAGQVGNTAGTHPNERAAFFGYFSGITTRADDRSVFIMSEKDLACVYPLVGGRTQLVLFADKSVGADWHGPDGRVRGLLDYFGALPDAPAVTGAVPETPVLGYADYPSQVRQPVVGPVPFVGDAALSLDPMSGVGCGFALASADLLGRAFADRALDKAGIEDGLADYQRRFDSVILPHAEGIIADSVVSKDDNARRKTFDAICGDADLSRKYLALTGRMLLPAEFQRALMRSLLTAAMRKRS
jgi:flavin-dependent dehydrogenase